jgi:TetR/AcrR family transcriptional regulator, transcriptional repressor of aconitase
MPRVSQEHLDARRRQILEAARRAFIRNGFHATSMQDVFRESGLSAGAVYHYFGSKRELIAAIADVNLGLVAEVLDELDETRLPSLGELIARFARRFEQRNQENDIAKLIGQVWAEAIRSPEIAEMFRAKLHTVLDPLTRAVRIYQDAGRLPANVPPEVIASTIAAFVQGFMLQLAVRDDVDVADFETGVRALVDR